MKKLNTTLLIITTIIAIFFFGKWINDVRPRYEWREKIDFYNSSKAIIPLVVASNYDYCFSTSTIEYVNVKCDNEDLLNEEYKRYVEAIYGEYRCPKEAQLNYTVCYKKERVRIK